MGFVKHPLIKKGALEEREYQQNIVETCLKKNVLCVLPTGLGKTPIAVLLAARMLEKFPDSKILVLAPTRPLVNQHHKSFIQFLDIPEDDFEAVTGTVNPEYRKIIYTEKKVILGTPQTVRNDLKKGRLDLKEFSLLVIDEIHHAVGRYAYPYVCKAYQRQARNPRILGLTASPGGTTQKIQDICNNCGIQAIEVRGEEDYDVAPYVKKKSVEWAEVELPPSFLKVKIHLEAAYKRRVENLKRLAFIRGTRVTKKQLILLQNNLVRAMKKGYKRSFIGLRYTAQAIKIEHALGLLETQGINPLEKYWNKLREDPKAEPILRDPDIVQAMARSRELKGMGSRHPKMGRLCSVINQTFQSRPASKVIIFANYRDTVKEIIEVLSRIGGARPVEFVGQRGGLTQAEQMERIEDFKAGKYNVLVGTSISEEGLDIPAMDLAVFYEPVPSEIRSIQRRGRVGRQTVGRVVVLITKNTRDEAYYWTAKNKEKRMKSTLKGMSRGMKQGYLKRLSF